MNISSLYNLSPSEKLQLVEDLWDHLASIPSDVPVHEWQLTELTRRKANSVSNPGSLLSWVDVKARIRNRHAN